MTNANTETKQSLNYGQQNTKPDNDFKEINHNMSLNLSNSFIKYVLEELEKWAS